MREDGALNGYQRRLIYQLVRAEFPGLRVFGRNNGDFMQVEKLDEKKEAEVCISRAFTTAYPVLRYFQCMQYLLDTV